MKFCLSVQNPILQIAYALAGAYRSLGAEHASRNPNQTPGLPLTGEGVDRG